MVVGPFPALKLAVLACKQISKPIATSLKENCKDRPWFRQYICVPTAHMYNWMEVKYKMWIMNLGKPVNIPQLTEPMAIELGANLLGEFIIFTIGAGLLIFEYVRSSNKESKKEEVAKQEKLELALTLSELAFRAEKQDTQIRELTRVLAEIESRSIFNFGLLSQKKNLEVLPTEENFTISTKFHGNYNPSYGLISEALNYIETELFHDRT